MQENKVYETAHFLRSILQRKYSGLQNENIYNNCYSDTKELVNEYYSIIVKSLNFIFESEMEEKFQFFQELKHSYGRTGLFLSGGGIVGCFHLGILSALLEQNLLPNIIAGSSAGSLIASLIGTKTIPELKKLSSNQFCDVDFSDLKEKQKIGLLRSFIRILRFGYFLDKKPLTEFMKK